MTKAQTCYYPNSTTSPDVPCHSDATESACCNNGATCLSNGLCLGGSIISRGSCTDQSWENPNCPQYCADVNVGGGAPIFLVGLIHNQWLFCCSPWNNNICDTSTKGSDLPFAIEGGPVILNRTSGSTSTSIPNPATATETTTFTSTVTAAALASASTSSSVPRTSLSCSDKEAAVGAGLGVTLGIALLIALGLLWTLRKHKQHLRTVAQTWEWRYNELTTRVVTRTGAVHHQLPAWTPGELDGRPKSLPSEMADRPR